MEQEGKGAGQVEQRSSLPAEEAGAGVTQTPAGDGTGYDIEVRRAIVDPAGNRAYRQSDPIVQVVREIMDLPRQILPQETYFHLKNAAKEATLAVISLVNSLGNPPRSSGGGGGPKHIDVE